MLFIDSSVDRYLGCFCLLVEYNNIFVVFSLYFAEQLTRLLAKKKYHFVFIDRYFTEVNGKYIFEFYFLTPEINF